MTTPSVPSLPASNDGQWMPTVSFGSPASEPTIDPSARTASTPSTWVRIVPKRTTRDPPALVATAPPTVAESRLAKSTGVSRPAARACSRQRDSVTPAPAVTCMAPVSTGPRSSRRRVESTTIGRSRGTLPPTRPVLPPCGTSGAPALAHAATTAAVSAVSPGRTTSATSPAKRPVQSVAYDAVRSASARTWSRPTIWASSWAREQSITAPVAAAVSGVPARPRPRRRTAGHRRGRRHRDATSTRRCCRATRRPDRGAGR